MILTVPSHYFSKTIITSSYDDNVRIFLPTIKQVSPQYIENADIEPF